MIKWTKSCLFLLLFAGISQNFFNLNSSTILAQGTETTHLAQTSSGKDGNNPSFDSSALAEESLTEAIWFGSVEEVTIATRRETPISKAPSIVTVITAEEIKNLGYRTFAEILRIVPGFEILKFADFGIVGPSVRGLATSSDSNRIRLMIDGHFVNNPFRGGAFTTFDDFPVENIKRIEIIRGPGSAVYGENAFLGVINIITKDAKDIDGVRVSSGYGSFDTYDENILFGKTYGEFGISGMARYRQTSGFDGTVERDRQTTLDNSFPTPPFPDASQAPGKVHDGRQEYDII